MDVVAITVTRVEHFRSQDKQTNKNRCVGGPWRKIIGIVFFYIIREGASFSYWEASEASIPQ